MPKDTFVEIFFAKGLFPAEKRISSREKKDFCPLPANNKMLIVSNQFIEEAAMLPYMPADTPAAERVLIL